MKRSVLIVSLVTVPLISAFLYDGRTSLAGLPWNIVALALGLTLLFAIVGAAGRLGRTAMYVFVGALVLAGAWYFFVGAESAMRAYLADPSCQAGFALSRSFSRECRLEGGTIVDAYLRYGRRGARVYHLVVNAVDGSRYDIRLGKPEYGSVYQGAMSGDRSATLQIFRGKVTRVATSSGMSETADYPAARVRSIAMFGIVFGAMGTLAAFSAAFRMRRTQGPTIQPFL
jgi:hypothetical protein